MSHTGSKSNIYKQTNSKFSKHGTYTTFIILLIIKGGNIHKIENYRQHLELDLHLQDSDLEPAIVP